MSEAKKFPVCVYNDKGQETYREEENGFWVKREYDDFGRQVFWENCAGEWVKHKFDDAGNEVYYENSDGFWCKSEYSESGFRTYYEDSTGKTRGIKSVCLVLDDAVARSQLDIGQHDCALAEKER